MTKKKSSNELKASPPVRVREHHIAGGRTAGARGTVRTFRGAKKKAAKKR